MNMSKAYGRKVVFSLAGATVTCLGLLLFLSQHQRTQMDGMQNESEVGLRSLQSLGESEADDGAQPEQNGKKGFSAYFSKLTRSRREADKPTEASGATTDAPPAEDISAGDIFIAVKTTKKFHRARLDLLLDTWISRNMQQVCPFTRLQTVCINYCTLWLHISPAGNFETEGRFFGDINDKCWALSFRFKPPCPTL